MIKRNEVEQQIALLMMDVDASWPEDRCFAVLDFLEEGRLDRALVEIQLMTNEYGGGDHQDEIAQLLEAWHTGQVDRS